MQCDGVPCTKRLPEAGRFAPVSSHSCRKRRRSVRVPRRTPTLSPANGQGVPVKDPVDTTPLQGGIHEPTSKVQAYRLHHDVRIIVADGRYRSLHPLHRRTRRLRVVLAQLRRLDRPLPHLLLRRRKLEEDQGNPFLRHDAALRRVLGPALWPVLPVYAVHHAGERIVPHLHRPHLLNHPGSDLPEGKAQHQGRPVHRRRGRRHAVHRRHRHARGSDPRPRSEVHLRQRHRLRFRRGLRPVPVLLALP